MLKALLPKLDLVQIVDYIKNAFLNTLGTGKYKWEGFIGNIMS